MEDFRHSQISTFLLQLGWLQIIVNFGVLKQLFPLVHAGVQVFEQDVIKIILSMEGAKPGAWMS